MGLRCGDNCSSFYTILKNIILFAIGGLSYLLIELLWRGYSHWSMFLLGGLCFFIIGLINERVNIPIIFEMLIGTSLITALEFGFGYILNIRLNLNIWDYSDMPLNILGQVCIPYMAIWFILSFFCIIADDNLRYYLFGETRKKYTLI